jgi:hypothetical protein
MTPISGEGAVMPFVRLPRKTKKMLKAVLLRWSRYERLPPGPWWLATFHPRAEAAFVAKNGAAYALNKAKGKGWRMIRVARADY